MTRVDEGDYRALDRALIEALGSWRARCDRLSRMAPWSAPAPVAHDLETSPLPERLVHVERRAELREHKGDPLAAALVPWVEVLASEDEGYRDRLEVARSLAELRAIPGRDRELSFSALRRVLLTASHPSVRRLAGDDLGRLGRVIGDVVRPSLERRIERARLVPPECRPCAVAELPWNGDGEPPATAVATRLLDATDDLAASFRTGAWEETLHLAFATRATEGWPARLGARWVADVFRGTDVTRRLRLKPYLPATWGALSYAMAIGGFGAHVLDASRPQTLPFALHQHPLGVRRHVERTLFASIVAEPAFALRVLGLGRARAFDHRREVARALLVSLRIDAWRVVVGAAAYRGQAALTEAYRDLGERVLGPGLPAELVALLPLLRPGDGAALCGALLAAERRERLIANFDVDWFANPRAIEELLHDASLARSPEPLPIERLEAATQRLVTDLADAIG